jgi:hypothetical protein
MTEDKTSAKSPVATSLDDALPVQDHSSLRRALRVEAPPSDEKATAQRPQWKDRKTDETLPDFILRVYAREIAGGTLTKAILRMDQPLYRAFFNYQRLHQLPLALRDIPSKKDLMAKDIDAHQSKEILTLKPTFMGMSVDLKELSRRALRYWHQRRRGSRR